MKRFIYALLAVVLLSSTVYGGDPVRVIVDDFENIGYGTKWVVLSFRGSQLQMGVESAAAGGHDGKGCAVVRLAAGESIEIARESGGRGACGEAARLVLSGAPAKVGLWLKGNNSATQVRVNLSSGSIDLARLDFSGWKYVERDLPPAKELPVRLKGLVFDAGEVGQMKDLVIHFDDLTITTTARGECPLHVDFEQLDPQRAVYENQPFSARVVLQNLQARKQGIQMRVDLLTAKDGEAAEGRVLRSEPIDVELQPGQMRAWTFEYALEAGVYSGRVVLRDVAGAMLGERRVAYRVFPGSHAVGSPPASFEVYSSGLSPFVLVRNDGPRTLLFQGLEAWGLGGPSHVAYVEDHKVKVVSTDQPIDPSNMTESWMLFWYGGAKGWDKLGKAPYPIDVPILVVLQKMPAQIKPAGTGLEFVFAKESGYIAMVPFYGVSWVRASQTAAWEGAFPQEVFKRCRLLAEISREYPIKVEEHFKLHPSQDRVFVRNRFEFLSIDDEWATGHRKVAPLEYMTALAYRSKFRLLSIAEPVLDLDMPVGAGLFAGVEGEEYTYTLSGLLRYVNQVELPRSIPGDHPLLAEARRNFNWNQALPGRSERGVLSPLVQAAAVAPYLSYADAGTQRAVRLGMRQAIDRALDPKHFAFEYDRERGRMLIVNGGDRGCGGGAGADHVAAESLRNLSEIIAATGDVEAVGGRWSIIRSLYNVCINENQWGDSAYSSRGGDAFDSQLAGTVGFARLAYWAGDEEAYRLACYHAAKQLLALWTISMAWPEWVKEKNLWAGIACVPGLELREENGEIAVYDVHDREKGSRRVELADVTFSDLRGGNVGLAPGAMQGFSRAGDAELRFIKDRMSEYGKHFIDAFAKQHMPDWHKAVYVEQGAVTPVLLSPPLKGQVAPVLRPRLDEYDALFKVRPAEAGARRQKFWENNGGIKGHEFEIMLAGMPQKYAPLWQDGVWVPQPDNVFRAGLGAGAHGGSPAWTVTAVGSQGCMLSWLAPFSPEQAEGSAVGGLPLGGIGSGGE